MSNRSDFMRASDRAELGNLPRTHQNCIDKTGVARPGKTAQEKVRRENRSRSAEKPVESKPAAKSKKR